MKLQKRWFGLAGLLVLVALVVAACGAAAPALDATTVTGDSEFMAGDDTSSTVAEDPPVDSTMDADADDSMKDADSDDSMQNADEEAMPDLPTWFGAELTDVSSGETFTLADYQGKVVLVETMAIWCSNCLRQQKEVKALHESLAGQEGWLTVVLDIDPNEDAENLKNYADKNGFDWIYVVASREVAREIGQLYGNQFLNPPSTPMLIIDQHGEVHLLPFGIKQAGSLQEALAPFLSDEM